MLSRTSIRILSYAAACLLIFCGPSLVFADISPLVAKLQPYVDRRVMAGAVLLVGDKHQILSLDSVGYSDLEAQKPMRTDTLFWIASMTKPMTAAAFMMLVEEGRVKLDDPVDQYIPAFKELKVAMTDGSLVPPGHPIKIRELLSHTSGMRFLNTKDRHVIDSVPLEVSIENDLLEPLTFDPGTKYAYSNEGIDTIGRIIEIITHKTYEQFLQERLFTPLKMTDTTFHPTAAQLTRLAKSYRTKADKSALEETKINYLTYPLDGPARYPAPGGGLFSTASDVCRFCQMLLNKGMLEGKRYLSEESVHLMTIKQTGPEIKTQYGFGIGASDGNSFGHGGAFNTNMQVSYGQIRVFLVQQANEWIAGNPFNDFTEEAKNISSIPQMRLPEVPSSIGTQIPAR